MRHFHSWFGLLAALLVSFLAISGAFLATEPMLGQLENIGQSKSGNVAELASLISKQQPSVERIVQKASGTIIAYTQGDNGPQALVIDPKTGDTIANYAPSQSFGFVTDLHRALLNGDNGRIIVGIGAGILMFLAITGLFMLVKRAGGWGKFLRPAKGTFSQRLHSSVAKWSLIGLSLSAATGLYMSLAAFGIVADGSGADLAYPTQVLGTAPMSVGELSALQNIAVSDLRDLTFPFQGDLNDVFSITTKNGQGYIDQASGDMIAFQPNSFGQSLYETIYMLHTGEGGGIASALLALMLGLSSIGIPALCMTGLAIWWSRKQQSVKMPKNAPLSKADIVVLVGSEENSTWHFAATLVNELQKAGQQVHAAPMNALSADHMNARELLILTSTYGDGDAPSSASHFMDRLAALNIKPRNRIAVLGFGDRQFPNFCGFAYKVEQALLNKGCSVLLPLATNDRQNPQAFATWGANLGDVLGIQLPLDHRPKAVKTNSLALQSVVARSNNAPSIGNENADGDVIILRFAPGAKQKRLPRFTSGDLIGIVPPSSHIARFYSIASSSKDGFLEVCVKRHFNGVCSNYLHDLKPGDNINYFVKANPSFKTKAGKAPIILVGAGTGLAPLVGFARENKGNRPMHLYWGGRSANSDFVYKDALIDCLKNRSLTHVAAAFSRGPKHQYVQDRLHEEADSIRALTEQGAQFLICGGQPMAASVRSTLDEILLPSGLSVNDLKSSQRYLEDVY